MPDITQNDYQNILQQVNNGSFRYIILVTGFQSDVIMQSVYERYFYVKSIGPYAIYDKYSPEGYLLVVSFVNELNQSRQEYWAENGSIGTIESLNRPDNNIRVDQLSIDNNIRPAIKQVPIGQVTSKQLPSISEPANSSLIFENVYIPNELDASIWRNLEP